MIHSTFQPFIRSQHSLIHSPYATEGPNEERTEERREVKEDRSKHRPGERILCERLIIWYPVNPEN